MTKRSQAQRIEQEAPVPQAAALGGDLLIGAEAIAEFVFGDKTKRRQVYWAAETGALPIFKLNPKQKNPEHRSKAMLWARRSTLLQHIEQRDQHAIAVE